MRIFASVAMSVALGVMTQWACASVAATDDPELLFVMWDPVAKVSYTKDLGIRANTFWITGQQDAGSQTLINLTSSADSVLAEFLKVSKVSTNQHWAVIAIDPGPGLTPGDRRLFTTLTQGTKEGVVNSNWVDMTRMQAGDLQFNTQLISESLFLGLNFPNPESAVFNTHRTGGAVNYAVNGSSFDSQGGKNYFAAQNGFRSRTSPAEPGDAFGGIFSTTNLVGQSSWFYYLTNTAGKDLVEVDEFDNLGANGYWGLALKSAGSYLLSYTMPAYDPSAKASSAEGRMRLSVTDFAAGLLSRPVTAPANEFADYPAAASIVTSVPEPATWVSLALGLGLVGGAARRRVTST